MVIHVFIFNLSVSVLPRAGTASHFLGLRTLWGFEFQAQALNIRLSGSEVPKLTLKKSFMGNSSVSGPVGLFMKSRPGLFGLLAYLVEAQN